MWESLKRAFGKAEAKATPPSPKAAATGEPRPAELAQYLQDLTTSLHTDAHRGRVAYEVPPPALEHRLNGGANPRIARYYADVLTRPTLPADAQILDMGCGYGRIALELATRLAATQRYVGLDPHLDAIDWAAGNITPLHPNFTFAQVDISSKVYNADGTLDGSSFRFPFEDSSLDLVFMVSVLTHVDIDTLTTYAREAARTLKPTGRLVATLFLLDDEVDELIAAGRSVFEMRWPHGPSRVENPKNPELAIAHPRDLVLRIFAESGFSDPAIVEGSWSGRPGHGPMDFQDLVIAPRSAAAAAAWDSMDGSISGPSAVLDHDPELKNGVAGSAETPETETFQDAAAQLTAIGLPNRDAAAELLTWANPIIINALWWQDRGFSLAVDHGDRLEPFGFSFAACRALGFDERAPAPADTMTTDAAPIPSLPTFTPVSPHDLLDLLVDAGDAVTPLSTLRCSLEVADYGVQIRHAQQSGKQLVLVSDDLATSTAPIPRFS